MLQRDSSCFLGIAQIPTKVTIYTTSLRRKKQCNIEKLFLMADRLTAHTTHVVWFVREFRDLFLSFRRRRRDNLNEWCKAWSRHDFETKKILASAIFSKYSFHLCLAARDFSSRYDLPSLPPLPVLRNRFRTLSLENERKDRQALLNDRDERKKNLLSQMHSAPAPYVVCNPHGETTTRKEIDG